MRREAACAAEPRCLAFSSAGTLRNFTNSTRGVIGTDLFVKHAQPQPETDLPWPLPTNFSRGSVTLCLGRSFHFEVAGAAAEKALSLALKRADARTAGRRSGDCVDASAELRVLTVSIAQVEEDLQFGVDETYNLTVPRSGGEAKLVAATQFGALHGLETFTQLVSLRAAMAPRRSCDILLGTSETLLASLGVA